MKRRDYPCRLHRPSKCQTNTAHWRTAAGYLPTSPVKTLRIPDHNTGSGSNSKPQPVKSPRRRPIQSYTSLQPPTSPLNTPHTWCFTLLDAWAAAAAAEEDEPPPLPPELVLDRLSSRLVGAGAAPGGRPLPPYEAGRSCGLRGLEASWWLTLICNAATEPGTSARR